MYFSTPFLVLAFFALSLYWDIRAEKLKSINRFEGQVSGFLAGLSFDDGICSEYTARQIFGIAKQEINRLSRWKGSPPEEDNDPFYYVQHEFGDFAFLCIEKYALHYCENEKEAESLLHFCREKKNPAHRLTQDIPSGW